MSEIEGAPLTDVTVLVVDDERSNVESLERIFVREGYHGATIRKIADEVGVSSTALYMHFRDKSEILVEICQDAFAQLIAQTDAIVACQS